MEETRCTVTEVVLTAPLQRRIFLFGSMWQFASYLIVLLLIYLACAYFMGPHTPRAQFIVTMLGAFIGTLPALLAALPARFTIAASGAAVEPWLRDLDSKLYWMGYRRAASVAGVRYEHCFPRWLRWTENSFDITCKDGRILVMGPVLATRRLRREMAAQAT